MAMKTCPTCGGSGSEYEEKPVDCDNCPEASGYVLLLSGKTVGGNYRKVPCPICNGTGKHPSKTVQTRVGDCQICDGNGEVNE